MYRTLVYNLAIEQIATEIIGLQNMGLSLDEAILVAKAAIGEVQNSVDAERARREFLQLQNQNTPPIPQS